MTAPIDSDWLWREGHDPSIDDDLMERLLLALVVAKCPPERMSATIAAFVAHTSAGRRKVVLKNEAEGTAKAVATRAVRLALERAAAWHILQAENALGMLHCGSENSEFRAAGRANDIHRSAAKSLNAMATDEFVVKIVEQARRELS